MNFYETLCNTIVFEIIKLQGYSVGPTAAHISFNVSERK